MSVPSTALTARKVGIDTYRENVVYLRRDCPVYRAEGFQALSKVEVKANGKPLLVVPMPSLSDKPGANLARPDDVDAASAEVELPAGKNIELSVSGWKKGFISGAKAEVSGKAWLLTGANDTVITLASEKPKGPQFVLYFSARPARHDAHCEGRLLLTERRDERRHYRQVTLARPWIRVRGQASGLLSLHVEGDAADVNLAV